MNLDEINLSHITNHEELFGVIREKYKKCMWSSNMLTWWMWDPAAADFIQISVEEGFVTLLDTLSLPSEQSIRDCEYHCVFNLGQAVPMTSELFIYLLRMKYNSFVIGIHEMARAFSKEAWS